MPLAHDLIHNVTISNAGLALTRLAPPLTSTAWGDYVSRIAESACPPSYGTYFERCRARTAAGAPHRRVVMATSLSPVICGMGERTPGENGLTLHPVYGVPYLPGSSLKGIVRAWVLAQGWDSAWCEGGEYFDAMFGAGGHEGGSAVVDFLDALPVPAERLLAVDVLTPHASSYYQGRSAPLGWDGPNPVKFLTAAMGVRFRVVVEGQGEWVTKATEWLCLALNERGVGAKSRAGYGRFSCEVLSADDRGETKARERNVGARQTATDRAILRLEARGADAVRSEVEKWLRGEKLASGFVDLFPAALDGGPGALANALRTVGLRWAFRSVWQARAHRGQTDANARARAAALVDAWDRFCPPGSTPVVPAAPPATVSAPVPAGRFGPHEWIVPAKGTRSFQVVDAVAGRAGTARAHSLEAVETCLKWLAENGGKPAEINKVRQAYGLAT
jgi:CRISPR-associated protein Cmr6